MHTMKRICDLVGDTNADPKFKTFIDYTWDSEIDKIWKLRTQFVFRNFPSYFGFYLAVRCSNWELCLACLKQMVYLFAAFDRDYYGRIIPDHLAQIEQYITTNGFTTP